jgi:hypothetical protein
MKGAATRDVPGWAIAAALAATLLVAVFLGKSVITGRAADPAPPMKVYPGMYDLRAEAMKPRTSQAHRPTSESGPADGR